MDTLAKDILNVICNILDDTSLAHLSQTNLYHYTNCRRKLLNRKTKYANHMGDFVYRHLIRKFYSEGYLERDTLKLDYDLPYIGVFPGYAEFISPECCINKCLYTKINNKISEYMYYIEKYIQGNIYI